MRPDNLRSRLPRVTRPRALAAAFGVAALLGFGCSPSRRASTQTPEPWLCALDGGRWCSPCGSTHPCPAGKGGWLCCSGDTCVAVPTTGDCVGGTVGYCGNYTEEKKCNSTGYCTEVATCHDGE